MVELLNKGVAPASLWDGLFLTAGELLMRQPGIVGLHCVTSTNALHYAYQTSGNDETRRLLLLQAAAFLPLFRQAMTGRGKLGDAAASTRWRRPRSKGDGPAAVEEIFADVSKDRTLAARKTLALLEQRRRRGRAADGGGPAADLRQGHRLARLQVQLGRAGGLLPRRRRPGATATWPRACSTCAAPATATTT